jgi:hypothetical protein
VDEDLRTRILEGIEALAEASPFDRRQKIHMLNEAVADRPAGTPYVKMAPDQIELLLDSLFSSKREERLGTIVEKLQKFCKIPTNELYP